MLKSITNKFFIQLRKSRWIRFGKAVARSDVSWLVLNPMCRGFNFAGNSSLTFRRMDHTDPCGTSVSSLAKLFHLLAYHGEPFAFMGQLSLWRRFCQGMHRGETGGGGVVQIQSRHLPMGTDGIHDKPQDNRRPNSIQGSTELG